MRVVVLGIRGIPNIPGGIEKHCEKLFPRLVRKGVEVLVLGRSPYIGNKPYTFKGIKIIPLWCPRNKRIETIFHTFIGTIYALFLKPDIIHFHALGPSLFVNLARLFRKKVIATHHGFDYDRDKWGTIAKFTIKMGEKRLCRADRVISISQHISDSLQSRFHCKSELIPNGVEIPEKKTEDIYCRKWKISKGKYFLFAGRLVPEKCVHVLFDAFGMIQTDWKLVIAGDADHQDTYSRKLKSRGMSSPGVVMTGYIVGDELEEVFSNAGAFILPSTHEGLPIALLEALSHGLPCIVSDIPANRSVKYDPILFFPVNDVTELASRMAAIQQGDIKWKEDDARRFVKENYDWDKIALDTLAVFNEVCRK